MKKKTKIDISHKTIFFIDTFLGILWLLFQIKEVILILFVAIIFMSALNPIVESLTKRSVPKGMAIALAYVVLIGIIVGLLTLIITPLTAETSNLLFSLPQTIQKL